MPYNLLTNSGVLSDTISAATTATVMLPMHSMKWVTKVQPLPLPILTFSFRAALYEKSASSIQFGMKSVIVFIFPQDLRSFPRDALNYHHNNLPLPLREMFNSGFYKKPRHRKSEGKTKFSKSGLQLTTSPDCN
ncbi:hypothetical protein ACTXT7_002553 [Hymenolepis weldensis]